MSMQSDIDRLEKSIDDLVFSLYELSAEERKIITSSIS